MTYIYCIMPTYAENPSLTKYMDTWCAIGGTIMRLHQGRRLLIWAFRLSDWRELGSCEASIISSEPSNVYMDVVGAIVGAVSGESTVEETAKLLRSEPRSPAPAASCSSSARI